MGWSPGMLNGISRVIRPSVPYTTTLWSDSARIDTPNDARRSPNSSTPATTVSTPETGSRRTAAWIPVGSPPMSMRDRFMQ